ncbi:sterol-binding protein [Oxalobacteraceae bacterium CAVE-383]|nr:sterol-binding protein [Oxalobacteraceae bacterium CAVE-383]
MTPDSLHLLAPLCHAINHLLAQEPWARQKLLAHCGKTAAIDMGALTLRLRVTVDGMVEAAEKEAASDVTIRLKLSDLPLLAANAERAFSYVKIEGDADFANTISQLTRDLRWDAGHDLSKVFGEIAAQRMVSGAASAFASVRATHRSFTENLAEYFLEEQPMLVRPSAVAEIGGEVGKLRDDVERLAKRIEKLEGKR